MKNLVKRTKSNLKRFEKIAKKLEYYRDELAEYAMESPYNDKTIDSIFIARLSDAFHELAEAVAIESSERLYLNCYVKTSDNEKEYHPFEILVRDKGRCEAREMDIDIEYLSDGKRYFRCVSNDKNPIIHMTVYNDYSCHIPIYDNYDGTQCFAGLSLHTHDRIETI